MSACVFALLHTRIRTRVATQALQLMAGPTLDKCLPLPLAADVDAPPFFLVSADSSSIRGSKVCTRSQKGVKKASSQE